MMKSAPDSLTERLMADMKRYFSKPFRWAILYTLILAVSTVFVLLDTFVIPRTGSPVAAIDNSTDSTTNVVDNKAATASTSVSATGPASNSTTEPASGMVSPVITSNTYQDANIRITIEQIRQYDTDIYVADIQVSSASFLKTAFAQNTYGRNIKAATSTMAKANKAILAINGDYYGFRDYGFVIRNGTLYRTTAPKSGSSDGLLIDTQGNFSIINETRISDQSLANAWQVLSFGPALINNGKITVTSSSEVSQSMTSNPRTAIGQIAPLHYVFVVSDGRTSASAGLSLLELAQVFMDRGCTVAYNLDGGGSSTLWFNGQVINNPTDGRSDAERSVSDIVYIG